MQNMALPSPPKVQFKGTLGDSLKRANGKEQNCIQAFYFPRPHINSFLRPRSSLSLGVNLLGHNGNSQDGIMKDRN